MLSDSELLDHLEKIGDGTLTLFRILMKLKTGDTVNYWWEYKNSSGCFIGTTVRNAISSHIEHLKNKECSNNVATI